MSDRQNLDQKRAAHALECIQSIEDWDKQSDYRSYVNSLPANIVGSGLGQASAMLLARAQKKGPQKDAHRRLYDHLSEWLRSSSYQSPYRGEDDLVEAITRNDERTYVHAQSEALSWLKWAKKFARAYLNKRDSN